MRLNQCISRAVQVNAGGIATRFGGRTRTWGELGGRVARLADGLRRLGTKPGDRVAFLGLNSDRYFEYFFAVPWAGGVFVPINTRLAIPEIVYWLDDSGSSVLIVDDQFIHLVPEMRGAAAKIAHVVYAGEAGAPEGTSHYEALIEDGVPVEPATGRDDGLAGIFYTGGTTGRPKGVMHSHEGLLANAFHTIPALGWDEETNYLHAAPMFHLADGWGTFAMALTGGANTIIPRFAPRAMLAAIGQHRVTASVLVPTMINMLVSHPDVERYDLSSLESIAYGGSPMPDAVISRTLRKLPGVGLFQACGQTEAAPVLTLLGPDEHRDATKTRSAGRAAIGCEVAILDVDGREVPRGQVGEICGQGDNVMLGYWNQPELSAYALRDGWLHTGDAAYMDGEGYVFVVDRLKDMIVTGGENVYCAEVENAIHQHPAVVECAVIGVEDSEWGERVHAVVYLEEGSRLDADGLTAHCRALIANYKCPRSVEFRCEPLPKSGAGKIIKSKLRDRAGPAVAAPGAS